MESQVANTSSCEPSIDEDGSECYSAGPQSMSSAVVSMGNGLFVGIPRLLDSSLMMSKLERKLRDSFSGHRVVNSSFVPLGLSAQLSPWYFTVPTFAVDAIGSQSSNVDKNGKDKHEVIPSGLQLSSNELSELLLNSRFFSAERISELVAPTTIATVASADHEDFTETDSSNLNLPRIPDEFSEFVVQEGNVVLVRRIKTKL